MGTLDTSRARPDHRVIFDGKVIGQTPGTFHVHCGWHQIQIGSAGTMQSLNVPCGGDLKDP